MAKRVYFASVKKWAKDNPKTAVATGAGTLSLLGIMFAYLIATGAITNYSFTGDSYCKGTLDDPCYAYINFTANEDIFVYPLGYDPWGRDTTVQFDPGVKSWELQRSWGNGWRSYDLTKPCAGTWCGAPSSDADTTYSLAWREGKTYQLRIVAYKNHPTDRIKWSAFDGEIDPVFLPVQADAVVINPDTRIQDEYKQVFVRNITFLNFTYYNLTHQNGTVELKINESIQPVPHIVPHYKDVKVDRKIMYKDKEFNQSFLNMVCSDAGICDSHNGDGNGDGICQAGESCCELDKLECDGFLADEYIKKIKIKGIDKVKVKVK